MLFVMFLVYTVVLLLSCYILLIVFFFFFISFILLFKFITSFSFFFFFNDTATPEIYTYCHPLSLHDALPIGADDLRRDGEGLCRRGRPARPCRPGTGESRRRNGRDALAHRRLGPGSRRRAAPFPRGPQLRHRTGQGRARVCAAALSRRSACSDAASRGLIFHHRFRHPASPGEAVWGGMGRS